jgi:hypothetical protein
MDGGGPSVRARSRTTITASAITTSAKTPAAIGT